MLRRVYFKNDGDCFDAASHEWLGRLLHTVGPWGFSTGIFARCRTTCPVEELRLEVIDAPEVCHEVPTPEADSRKDSDDPHFAG